VARVDVLLVSLGSTAGLRAADAELADSLTRAGASVKVAAAAPRGRIRTLALTDLAWARAARAAAVAGIAEHDPHAVLYSTTTAALLWPRPGAIRFDALAIATRPGRHGVWQRPRERRRLSEASLLVPWSERALEGAPAEHADTLVVPVAVEPSGLGEPWGARTRTAVTYAADPGKKGLGRVLEAWATARRDGESLVVTGLDRDRLPPSLPPGVQVSGRLEPDTYRSLLRSAKLYITAPRREDHGLAQLEALADGCVLVTTPAPGPYAALAFARELDARLVTDDLAPAIRAALDDPAPRYHERALPLLQPLTRAAVDRVVALDLLPRLLG
jgi:Glycosyl transferases group 1